MSGELYELALSVPWCITDEALEAMLRVAARDPLPEDETARRMHGPKALALRNGKRRDDSRQMTMRETVAVIPIDGPIYRYADFFTAVSGGVTTEALARDFQRALDDPAVGAILFTIDSPGGEATGINELADAIYAARGRKPIVAYIEGYGASAAYWLASAADRVVVDDTALVGSIGTVMGVPDPAKRISRTIDFVSRQSPKKRADPTSDAGRAYLQSLVDEMTAVFIAKVARNRGIESAAVLAVEGGLLVGQQAVDVGLADMIGAEEPIVRALAQGAALGLPILTAAPVSALLDQYTQKESSMAKNSFWADLFSGAKEAGLVSEASAEPLAPSASVPAPQIAASPTSDAREQELAQLRAELAKARAEQIQKDAQAFVGQHAGRTYPAESAALAALYVRAAEIDQAYPRTDGQPACVALLDVALAARPAHQLAHQTIAPGAPAMVLPVAQTEQQALLEQAATSARAYAARANGTGKS